MPPLADRSRALAPTQRALRCFSLWPLIAVMSCGGGSSGRPADVKLESASAMVSAAMGGKVTLADGTGLEVPPGALAADTLITLQRIPGSAFARGGTAAAIELAPDGLTLARPATLKLRYDPSKVIDEADLSVMVQSSANPLVRRSGEVNPFQIIETATIDPVTDIATVSVDHFSWYSVFSFPKANLALEIPGRYLRNGDILYTLTDAAEFNDGSATPMHVGMYVESPSNDRVIESTIPEADCTTEYIEGVDLHTYDGMKGFRNLCGAHIFMGARRPTARVTTESRAAAVAAAQSRRFKPYGIIGLNNSSAVGIVAGGISCVELTEDAWEEAGVNISLTPDTALWPHDQFWNTHPVTEIEAKVGDRIVLPIVAVFRHSKTRYTRLKTGDPGTVTVTAVPDVFALGRAQLMDASSSPQGVKDLVFTPSKDDVEGKVSFTFTMNAPDGSMATAALVVDTFPSDSGKQCETDTYFKMIDGYVGTWSGKAGGVPFTFEGATLELGFDIGNSTPGRLEFEATDVNSPRLFDPGWASLWGLGVLPTDTFLPGKTTVVPLPLKQLPGATTMSDPMTSIGCTGFIAKDLKSGMLTIRVHDDCLGADLTVKASGTPLKGSPGDGMTCELEGTFSGKLKPKP